MSDSEKDRYVDALERELARETKLGKAERIDAIVSELERVGARKPAPKKAAAKPAAKRTTTRTKAKREKRG